ncbi:CLUMA_CG006880, isoform A [Clunio marinus]|uniref:CLUMA_CG006880, isoform A n=1 Tax=Clunio marinus TaxID=568069 RepID=A0A1J1HZF4_9DIPT|nr:CLUMA_CG006880, isoform A [Clunio marinus]
MLYVSIYKKLTLVMWLSNLTIEYFFEEKDKIEGKSRKTQALNQKLYTFSNRVVVRMFHEITSMFRFQSSKW